MHFGAARPLGRQPPISAARLRTSEGDPGCCSSGATQRGARGSANEQISRGSNVIAWASATPCVAARGDFRVWPHAGGDVAGPWTPQPSPASP
eukprot:1876716-Alexandrium_andersonii.AAC.1